MNKVKITVLLILFLIPSISFPQMITFETTLGTIGDEQGEYGAPTSEGGYIFIGYSDFKRMHYSDIYVVKTDNLGNVLWTNTYGDKESDEGSYIFENPDGTYVLTGYMFNPVQKSEIYLDADICVIKIDSEGNELWKKTYGGDLFDRGYCVRPALDGGYLVVGSSESFGKGYGRCNVYTLKIDEDGNEEWSKSYGGSYADVGYSFDYTSDGGYVIAGYTQSFGAGNLDVYVLKITSNGSLIWSQTYGGSDKDTGSAVFETNDGGFVIGGHTFSFGSGENDFYFIKTDPNGKAIWAKTYGGTGYDALWCMSETEDNGYIIGGNSDSFSGGKADFYMIRVDAAGNFLWERTYGGSALDSCNSVIQTDDGGFLLTGMSYSYGEQTFLPVSSIYVIKTDSEGKVY